jgi:polyhydroxyalkanoate synthesis regulator protein
MAMFQQAMGMFSPFAANSAQSGGPQSSAPRSGAPSAPKPQAPPQPSDSTGGSGSGGGRELDHLRQQLAQMQQQLDRLSDEK